MAENVIYDEVEGGVLKTEFIPNDDSTNEVNKTTETAEQKKKFGVGEYAVLASAIVGAATMAVASFKFVKKQVQAGRNFLKCKREEKATEAAANENKAKGTTQTDETKAETDKKG